MQQHVSPAFLTTPIRQVTSSTHALNTYVAINGVSSGIMCGTWWSRHLQQDRTLLSQRDKQDSRELTRDVSTAQSQPDTSALMCIPCKMPGLCRPQGCCRVCCGSVTGQRVRDEHCCSGHSVIRVIRAQSTQGENTVFCTGHLLPSILLSFANC